MDSAIDPPASSEQNPNPSSTPAAPASIEQNPSTSSTPAAPASIEQNPNPSSTPAAPGSSRGSGTTTAPYKIPPWSEPPGQPYFLEVLKDGSIIEQLNASEKGAYMFGRIDLCDFVLEHPTISRFHAVLQFKSDGKALLYDLGSTHGTFVNKNQVKANVYVELHVGDVIRFGLSSRLYILQGPSELMPPECDLKQITSAKIHEEMLDREASLMRAKVDASLAEGISWGMDEDAVEEATEDSADEITWQTFNGQLTERQEKTREKILKRTEKVSNMRKEIQAIRAKDISQGGLTQGQQTQIARNEQRISQIMEELESFEETLNDSIHESIGARVGKTRHGSKKANAEDDNDISSDDDDFYDRTKKRPARKVSEQSSVETADSLLDKKESITNEMASKKALLDQERTKAAPSFDSNMEGDDLDMYMSSLSSQLVLDKTVQIEKGLEDLQLELDRITYLLKIADPTGDAARRRELKSLTVMPTDSMGDLACSEAKAQAAKPIRTTPEVEKQPQLEQPKISEVKKQPQLEQSKEKMVPSQTADPDSKFDASQLATGSEKGLDEGKLDHMNGKEFVLPKPRWLGATRETKQDEKVQELHAEVNESGGFINYNDRSKLRARAEDVQEELKRAGPGLILRKRKSGEQHGAAIDVAGVSEPETTTVADDVALLLKHKKGYYGLDGAEQENESGEACQSSEEASRPRRVLGPMRPAFLEGGTDYESWVPPEGQTGDGRTSLNERVGY